MNKYPAAKEPFLAGCCNDFTVDRVVLVHAANLTERYTNPTWQPPTMELEVFLNIYDLHPWNTYVNWLGCGAYHSGVEVFGKEFGYGCHDYEGFTGIYYHAPKQAVGAIFKERVKIGVVRMTLEECYRVLEKLKPQFWGTEYHILTKNCNNFSHEFIKSLGLRPPRYINRLASIGRCCGCCVPSKYMRPVIGAEEDATSSDYHAIISTRESDLEYDEDKEESHRVLQSPKPRATSSNSINGIHQPLLPPISNSMGGSSSSSTSSSFTYTSYGTTDTTYNNNGSSSSSNSSNITCSTSSTNSSNSKSSTSTMTSKTTKTTNLHSNLI